jgi:prefoldin subunit 5
MSQEDVQRISLERQQLQRQISLVETENADVEKSIWEAQMVLGKLQDQVGHLWLLSCYRA